MDCEKESVINRFNTMEEDQKMLIIGLGAEVLAEALNGDNDARNCFNGFADSDYVRETAKSISGQRLEKTNEQVKAQN
jgi:hypothetical protein